MVLLMIQKDRNLVIKSRVIEDYPTLKIVLQKETILNRDILKKYPKIEDTVDESFCNRLKNIASNEWIVDPQFYSENEQKKGLCQVCGNKRLLKLYKIVNLVNNEEMIIGSECIKEFEFRNKTDLDKVRKENIILRRNVEINKTIKAEKIINGWKDIYRTSPILIPLEYKQKHMSIYDEFKDIYEYLRDKPSYHFDEEDEILLRKLQKKSDEKGLQETKLKEYIKTTAKRDDLTIPKRDLVTFLDNNNKELRKIIEKDGQIIWGTACRITYDKWLVDLIPLLNDKLKPYKVNLLGLDENRRYNFYYKANSPLFSCASKEFIQETGGVLFKPKKNVTDEDLTPNIEELISLYSEINMSYENILKITNLLFGRMDQFDILEDYTSYGDIFIYSKSTEKHYQVKIDKIFNHYKNYYLPTGRETRKQELIGLIESSFSMNKKDYKHIIKERDRQ